MVAIDPGRHPADQGSALLHLLAENEDNSYVAYVSEQNLLPDDTGEPVGHPQTSVIFESFDHGQYKLRPRISH